MPGDRAVDPCGIRSDDAIDYRRATLIKDDRKRIFDDGELDANIAKMLRLKPAHVRPAS